MRERRKKTAIKRRMSKAQYRAFLEAQVRRKGVVYRLDTFGHAFTLSGHLDALRGPHRW